MFFPWGGGGKGATGDMIPSTGRPVKVKFFVLFQWSRYSFRSSARFFWVWKSSNADMPPPEVYKAASEVSKLDMDFRIGSPIWDVRATNSFCPPAAQIEAYVG